MSLTWEEKLQNTEQKQEDRRHALEKMGISVQSSGIKVKTFYHTSTCNYEIICMSVCQVFCLFEYSIVF